MRSIHLLIKFIWTSVLLAAGVLLFMYPIGELYEEFARLLSGFLYPDWARPAVGSAIATLALLALLPLYPKRRTRKSVSFEGTHGEVTIELHPVESTLERVASKLKEVKSIRIRLKPLENQAIRVMATAILLKDGDGDARQVTARVNSYIQAHTRKILGLPDVDVKLKVIRFIINMKTLDPSRLLLEAPQGPTTAELAGMRQPLQPTVHAAAQTVAEVASAYGDEAEYEEVEYVEYEEVTEDSIGEVEDVDDEEARGIEVDGLEDLVSQLEGDDSEIPEVELDESEQR